MSGLASRVVVKAMNLPAVLLALGSALKAEAEARGLSVSRADFGEVSSEPQAALKAATGSGARWVLIARSSIEDGNRVFWRASMW